MFKLSICVDCMHMAVNGEYQPNPDKEPLSAIDYPIVVDTESEPFFSWQSCDGCESRLGGDRWIAEPVSRNRRVAIDLFISDNPYGSTVWDIRYIDPNAEFASYFTPSQDKQQMLVGASHFWTNENAVAYCDNVVKDYQEWAPDEFVSITQL